MLEDHRDLPNLVVLQCGCKTRHRRETNSVLHLPKRSGLQIIFDSIFRKLRCLEMRFELGLEAPDPKRALRSAGTIAGSYVIGRMIPLLPYMLAANAHQALLISIACTLLALARFGFVKGHFTGVSKFKSAWQTALVGSLAASVAFGIAKLIS
jgi:VIT1/CCC1 family predicted Fe2+/Mn2+ transporter